MIPKVKGSHPWALILCNASDQTAPAWPEQDYFRTLVASQDGNGLYTWWQQISGGNLDFASSTVFGWYGLPNTAAEVIMWKRGEQVKHARQAAEAAGADLSGYRHTLAFTLAVVFKSDGTPVGMASGNVDTDVAYPITALVGALNRQPSWHWCSKCESMAFWDGSRPPGRCLAGDRHDHSASSYYALPHDTTFPNGQSGWRWCNKCETLIFQTATPAPCPAGGPHALGISANYVLHHDSTGPNEQQNWRWCNKCQALAFWDHSRLPGPCPVSDRHDHTGSANYSIPLEFAADLGFLAHESGHGFGLVHAFGTSRSGDFANDTRPGAYGDWTDIMSWEKTAKFAVPLFWRAGAGLSAPTLYNLGWLSDLDATTIVPPAAAHPVALRPLYGDTTGSNPTRMIRVIEPKQGWVYTAEYRVPLSWDQGIRTARVVIHAMRTLYQAGQDGWRWCANCEGLIYAGQTVCPAGGVHGDEPSEDYRLLFHRGSGDPIWRWCRRCSGLFFADNVRESECPAGGEHDGTGSSDYQVALGGTGQISGQSNWKWCNKCEGLAYDGNSTRGTCPAGGVHDHINSGDYALWTEDPPFPFQNKWRWCNKCQGLYYAGLGACQGHDVHRFGEDLDYALVHDLAGASGEGGWRWCSKCYAMAFYDSSRALGACAAGGTHDHSTSGQYVIPRDAEAEAGQRQWHWCSKCSALNYTDPTRGPGPCSAGGNHSPGNIEYLVAHDTSAVAGATGFRWCSKCENMVMGNSPASCIRGGNHDTSRSSNYVVRMDPASLAREQSYWRTCAKCSTLFALNSPDGSDEKPCAGGGKHSVTGEYFLTYVTPDPFWRWCSKCESMAFWDGSRSPGPCPAGGPHDHSASGSYIPPNFRLDVTQVVNDNLLAGGSWSDSSDRVRFDVTAMDASGATVQVTAT